MSVIETFPGFRIEVLSRLRPGKGHDAWFSDAAGAAVVDGATPLGADYPQDLAEFSFETAQTLASAPFDDIDDLHTGAIQIVAKKFEPAGYKRTAATSVVRLDGDSLHFAVLGDCRVLVETNDGVADVFDTTLSLLEQSARHSGLNAKAESVRRRTRVFEDQLYRIFGDQMDAAVPKVSFCLPLDEVRTIILMSDGAWNALPEDPRRMVAELKTGPLEESFDLARIAPLSDDTTIIRLVRAQ